MFAYTRTNTLCDYQQHQQQLQHILFFKTLHYSPMAQACKYTLLNNFVVAKPPTGPAVLPRMLYLEAISSDRNRHASLRWSPCVRLMHPSAYVRIRTSGSECTNKRKSARVSAHQFSANKALHWVLGCNNSAFTYGNDLRRLHAVMELVRAQHQRKRNTPRVGCEQHIVFRGECFDRYGIHPNFLLFFLVVIFHYFSNKFLVLC